MRTLKNRFVLLALLVTFAANGIACGQIEVPLILAADVESSFIELRLDGNGALLGTTLLEGSLTTLMTLDVGLIELLFHLPFSGVIEITDLLFGGTAFPLLGTPTGVLCTILDPFNPGGGTALVDIFDGQIDFDMVAGTRILPTNPPIGDLIPGGFVFELAFSDSTEMSLLDLFALAFGNSAGALTIEQEFTDVIDVTILGLPLSIRVHGFILLTSVSEVPAGALGLVQVCEDYLANL